MGKSIIQKAILDLHYSGNTDGFAMQREIGEWCNVELGPGLEEILDKADTGATVKKIDRIELQIDIGSKPDWLSQLSKEIATQLQKKLNELAPEVTDGVQEQTVTAHFFETFIYFLQKGYLPWWSTIRNRNEFSTLLLATLQNGITNDMKSHLLEMVSESVAKDRLIDQLSDNEWIQFIAEFYPAQKNEIQILFKDVQSILTIIPELKRKQGKAMFKSRMWELAADPSPKKALQQVAMDFVGQIFLLIDDAAKTAFKKIQPASVLMDEAMERIEKESEERLFKPGPKTGTGKVIDNKEEVKIQEKSDTRADEQSITEGIYINNAGLIILAPFIPTLFKKLNLASDDEIYEKELAVNLAAYLATGTEYAAEFELVFGKVLCGIDPSVQISTMVSFTEEQKKEVQELLLSAIEHWTVLQDTSPEGLRESFLQREGKLSFKNNEWILDVEQRPYDMLLQNLPWNISMIRLPWMTSLLKTDWGM